MKKEWDFIYLYFNKNWENDKQWDSGDMLMSLSHAVRHSALPFVLMGHSPVTLRDWTISDHKKIHCSSFCSIL
jgi:hypothetical protein